MRKNFAPPGPPERFACKAQAPTMCGFKFCNTNPLATSKAESGAADRSPVREYPRSRDVWHMWRTIRYINMLLGGDGNKYSNQGLGSYHQVSWCVRREITFPPEMHSVCSDLWVWFWSHKWRCAEADRGDSFSHVENRIITTIPFVKRAGNYVFNSNARQGPRWTDSN